MRDEGLEAAHLSVFLQTSRHRRSEAWYAPQASLSCAPTQDTFTLLGHARRLLRSLWKEGYRYTKAGVTLNDLAPCNRQAVLFGGDDSRGLKASQAMDAVNRKFGQGSLQLLGAGLEPRWKPLQQMRSPRYTTQLSEIMEAATF